MNLTVSFILACAAAAGMNFFTSRNGLF